MSSKKWDDGFFDDLQVIILEPDELSGSNKSIDIKNFKPSTTNRDSSKLEMRLADTKENNKLIMPLESFPGYMKPSEERAYKEYKRQQFPELFDVLGLENDKASEVPSLALTRSARTFATLLEAKLKAYEEEKRDKILH